MRVSSFGYPIVALAFTFSAASAPAQNVNPVSLRGAGATFPAPLYRQWITTYQATNGNASITYDAVGSGEGVKRFMSGNVDFAGSDESLSAYEATKLEGGAVMVPVTSGMIVLAYNIPGVTTELRLPREVYADIFAGSIRRWNDSRVQAANPSTKLPALDNAIVARLDSSGTTAAFTRHLASADPSWRTRGLGIGKIAVWPKQTMLAAGNEGVAARIKQSEGAIGYVEYGFAKRLGLHMAALQNKSGMFVAPSENSAQLALSARADRTSELERSVVDPTSAGAYPIVSYSWLFLYGQYRTSAKAQAIRDFVNWGLSHGQQLGLELGYVPLTNEVISLGQDALKSVVAK
jgi:phosphate transport system substrate-binding protein